MFFSNGGKDGFEFLNKRAASCSIKTSLYLRMLVVDPTKPYSNKRIFWDVDIVQLDYEQHAEFIITRVFDRGDVDDIRACRRFYPEKVIRQHLLNATFLSERRLALASAIIAEPKESFRCYISRQLNPQHLPY